MEIIKKILYPLAILSIILLSFFSFAPYYSTTLNSDLAVHILMTESLHFPNDFYYWAQDRLGSLLPMISHLVFVLLPIKSITAITIVQYAFLIGIFYFLQKLLSSQFSKFILCVIVFIPFPLMLEQVYIGHPYASQFLAISIVVFLHEFVLKKKALHFASKVLIYILISFFLMVSIWASEVSVFFVFLFVLYSMLSSIQFVSKDGDGFSFKLKINIRQTVIYSLVLLASIYFGFKFILYAKSFCYKQPGIEIWFTDFKTFTNMLDNFWINFRDSVEFRVKNIFVSIHNLVILIISIFLLIHTLINFRKNKKGPPRLAVFFLFNALFSFLFLMFSNWVALNSYGFRYFIYPYLFLTLSLIFHSDTLNVKTRTTILGLYLIGIIFFSIHTFQHIKVFYKLDERNFSLKRASKLTPLANSGVIAEYWYSYVLAINSDMNIKATPYETQYVRSTSMLDTVLTRKNIYLVRNRWLDFFPDTVKQFGLYLIKSGNPENISRVYFCKYKLADVHLSYYPKNADEKKGTLVLEKSPMIYSTDSIKQYNNEFIIYGPFTKLPPGKYKVSFDLGYSPTFSQTGKITFDVSENWGSNVFALQTKEFNNEIINSGRLVTEIVFETNQMKNLAEYRIKLNGIFNLSVNEVKVDRIN